jgi:hypothetical protein
MSSYQAKKMARNLENFYANYGDILQQPQFQQYLNANNITNPPNYQNMYEQAIQVRNTVRKQRDDYYRKKFKENFPRLIASILAIAMIIISLIEIVLQIVLIVKKAPISFIGSGIWAGAYGFITAGVILATSICFKK